MFTECTHTLESGSTCKSPAVRGTSLCFHHTPHENIKRQQPHEYEPFELPNMDTKSGILVAVTEILSRLAQRRIKRSEAETLLRGLKFAARLMTELDTEIASHQAEMDHTQSTAPADSEPSSKSVQKTIHSIAANLGFDLPTFEEIEELRASMSGATHEQAINAWQASRKTVQFANSARRSNNNQRSLSS
jgi:hypothetical protein